MKIYTKTGDTGTTGLFGGERISKSHERIEAYGNLDELNSYLGGCAALLEETGAEELLTVQSQLQDIQHQIFVIGSHLATPTEEGRAHLPQLHASWTEHLEYAIDAMEGELPELKNFILPGGSKAAAQLHIARAVARRTERSMVTLLQSEYVDPMAIQYINRLSDFLFVMARYVNMVLGHGDIAWEK